MRITILNEGIIYKNPYPRYQARIATKGESLGLGGGAILHAMRLGPAPGSPHSSCHLTLTADFGRTWSPPAPVQIAAGEPLRITGMWLGRIGRQLRGVAVTDTTIHPSDPRWRDDNGGWVASESHLLESNDLGRTWTNRGRMSIPDPPGGFSVSSSPIHALDGGLMMQVIEPFFRRTMAELQHEAAVVFSRDGLRWQDKAIIAQDPARRIVYFDPRLARLPGGRWVCALWVHDLQTDQSLNTAISWSDDGRRWTPPHPTRLWGFLTMPLSLPDGRLLAIYNHRRTPQGIQCALSEDEGRTWDVEGAIVLWDQAARRITAEPASQSASRQWDRSALTEMFTTYDFGIPSPVLLDDGTVFVSFYATQLDHVMHQRCVRFAVA